ncbi:hypothetical protein DPMN_049820 [Dreissena polymorpha]|uniref:Uncharacterized protein n=1 Tax=Dreissena polymorpha TaxID=45954 RepID=A0A9D4HNN7_DREPO|nr:hypothetical protein DPMN_049820 [Dreissena polymorpha]
MESAVAELNREVEKFGRPQQKQTQLVSCMPWRTAMDMFRHLVWNQVSHESQHTAFWLYLQGFWHSPQGNLYVGPGLGWQSLDCVILLV